MRRSLEFEQSKPATVQTVVQQVVDHKEVHRLANILVTRDEEILNLKRSVEFEKSKPREKEVIVQKIVDSD